MVRENDNKEYQFFRFRHNWGNSLKGINELVLVWEATWHNRMTWWHQVFFSHIQIKGARLTKKCRVIEILWVDIIGVSENSVSIFVTYILLTDIDQRSGTITIAIWPLGRIPALVMSQPWPCLYLENDKSTSRFYPQDNTSAKKPGCIGQRFTHAFSSKLVLLIPCQHTTTLSQIYYFTQFVDFISQMYKNHFQNAWNIYVTMCENSGALTLCVPILQNIQTHSIS